MMERPIESHGTEIYRVLIIDDNEAIHRDFRSLLESKPARDELADLALEVLGEDIDPPPNVGLPMYAFDSAYQGHVALETVKQASSSGRAYALAFVDVRMPPGWDGVETIQRIWEVDPNIQMIICSAYSDYSWDEIIQELGATDRLLILRKPFDPNIVKQMTLSVACKWSRDRASREHIHRLQDMIERRDDELVRLRSEVERLRAEVDEMTTAGALDASARAERAEELCDELGRLVLELEALAAASLSAEHVRKVEIALEMSRSLLQHVASERSAATPDQG